MKKGMKIFKISITALALLLISTLTPTSYASSKIGKDYSEPISLGSPIQSVAIYDSAYGKEDGRDVMYTTASGNPAIFQVVDLKSQEVLRTYELEGSSSSWTHITVPNGNVYIGGNGILYEYSPQTKELRNLGGIDESVVYGLSYDEEGRVYFGSYPNAKAGMYDPSTGEMTDFGTVAPGQSYSRSTAYHNGYLYLGIGTDNHLVKLNVETREYEKIELPDFVVPGSSVWQLDAAGKYIIAGVGGGNNALLFYDTETGEWSDKYYLNNKGLRIIHGLPGSNKVYFLQSNRLQELDLDTLEAVDTGVVFGTFLRNTTWIELENDPEFPGQSLVTVQFGGQVTFMNLETKKVKTTQYPIVGTPIPIQTLENGPDGKLYLSGYPGGKGAAYDPKSNTNTNFSLGQAEGMASIGNKMYFGIYPGATIHELDTSSSATSLKQIYDIPNQDRPFIMTPVGEKLYIGTIPDYGHLGGSLTVLDPNTVENTVIYENFIHNQSITGLAEKDGKLFGSTTVYGGLGITPTETAAKLFVWDIEKGEKIAEFVPQIPGVTAQPKMIGGIALGPDELIWAATDGTIFAIDPVTLEVVKSKNIFPETENYGKWRPAQVRMDDGLIYTTLAGRITVVDPISLEHEILVDSETELMTIGNDGMIYYANSDELMKIEVTDIVTLEEVLDAISDYTDEGNITLSLSQQLTYSVKQAIHHHDKDRAQAEHHVLKALSQLNNASPEDISEEAATELRILLETVEY
ncbi:MAG TPA: hypothetical protein VNM69_15675 [Bacillus sp. (in: firmicutes)]|nr:hypothetical protein [Bacillus sp. (in: firmicutes)]